MRHAQKKAAKTRTALSKVGTSLGAAKTPLAFRGLAGGGVSKARRPRDDGLKVGKESLSGALEHSEENPGNEGDKHQLDVIPLYFDENEGPEQETASPRGTGGEDAMRQQSPEQQQQETGKTKPPPLAIKPVF